MLEHIVLAKFKAGVKGEQIAELRKMLAALPATIPEIKRYKFGEDVRPEKTFDFALVSTFENEGAVKGYLDHPKHIIVAKYIRILAASLQIMDFEY
jgi:hypothetical protein